MQEVSRPSLGWPPTILMSWGIPPVLPPKLNQADFVTCRIWHIQWSVIFTARSWKSLKILPYVLLDPSLEEVSCCALRTLRNPLERQSPMAGAEAPCQLPASACQSCNWATWEAGVGPTDVCSPANMLMQCCEGSSVRAPPAPQTTETMGNGKCGLF
jgi:hypothetical protein